MKFNPMTNGKANGAAIRAIREARGKSIREMATGTGYDRGALSKVETGIKDASSEALEMFADWLKVPVAAISNPPSVIIQATPDNLRQITDMLAAPAVARARG